MAIFRFGLALVAAGVLAAVANAQVYVTAGGNAPTPSGVFAYTAAQTFANKFGTTEFDTGNHFNYAIPEGITFGPDGNVYVATAFGQNRVYKYSPAGTYLGTFVAEGQGGLFTPYGATFGPDHNLYVASYNGQTINRYDGTTGANLPSGAGNPASTATFTSGVGNVSGLTFGPDGNLYAVSGNKLYRADPVTGAATQINPVGDPNLAGGGFDLKFGPDNDLYVSAGNSVRRYTVAGGSATFDATFATGFGSAAGLAFLPNGDLLAGDNSAQKVYEFSPAGGTTGAAAVYAPMPGNAEGLAGVDFLAVNAVPEPSSLALSLAGAGLVWVRRRYGSRGR